MSVYALRGIRQRYDGRTVLEIDRLTIRDGITALVGPNGSGKSTLLRLLALLEAPVEGEIRMKGRLVSARSRSIRRRIGWVMQQPYLFRGTALENVMLGLKLRKERQRRERSMSILSSVGFDADPLLSVVALSGGQRQLVALARCLVLEPEILLLDEPFNHLDKCANQCLEDILRRWVREGKAALVFSSHDVHRSQALSDSLIALEAGQLTVPPCGNVFSGRCSGDRFDTGKIEVVLPSSGDGSHVAIDPCDITLSLAPLFSSMRNRFRGEVIGMEQSKEGVRVTVLAGERFEALVTHASAKDMGLTFGQPLWVNFKSLAVKVF